MKFVDEVSIEVSSGKGGAGAVSFRREKYVPRGGPDGGDGGRGGHVIFKTSTRIHSLLDLKLKTKYAAPDGEKGGTQNRAGKDGEDLILWVPPGTVIKDEAGSVIRDLGNDAEFVFLEGGMGGRGNPFYKSSVNQAPGVAQKGMAGKKRTILLELKLLADVGIIGYPNAGKSTLISHISAARPKVADYPFTTLIPNLGVVRYGDEHNFVVADMPGLIKDAHKGVGLGTRFLKHIERTKCFVHVVDGSGMSGRSPLQDFKDINHELKMYDKLHSDDDDFKPLFNRLQIVALNKADVISEEEQKALVKKFEKIATRVIVISAATGKNLKELVHRMGEMVFNGEQEKEDISSKNEAYQAEQKREFRQVKAQASGREKQKAIKISHKKISSKKARGGSALKIKVSVSKSLGKKSSSAKKSQAQKRGR